MNVSKLLCNKVIVSPGLRLFRRSIQTTSVLNMVKNGDALPDATLYEDTPADAVDLKELSKGKKIIVFAVPGAFTPGCSNTHLPGYIEKCAELRSKGIAEIVCISVNDAFVMAAWGKEHNVEGKIRMLADPLGEFTKKMELGTDIPPLGGFRSKRYSMVIDDGKITNLQVEPDGTGLSCSLANKIKI